MTDPFWAIKTGDLSQVKESIEKEGFNVNTAATNNKTTPLHAAADFGQVEIIKYLISKGANVDAKDSYGHTPLHLAVYESHTEAVKVLIEKGASTKIVASNGKTPLEVAEKDEIKKLLSAAKK
eukprot:TRINITY_DN11384_c0_g1_i1.p1 TRINITY_DN11384_c0_g1~~TRINITY_DN11384_c0_g1_i1.p1  ORF type:complete len:130 (-),score=23.14 TRINITY_DN11384_c0_g1_i1:119-487(-)